MSWFKDPELFMEFYDSEIRVWRLRKKSGSPIEQSKFTRESNVTDYLALVENSFQWKKSDFDALADFLYKNDILVNCQGLVLTLTFPRDRAAKNHPDMSRAVRFWSHDVVNLACYGLPVSSIPFREVQYIHQGGCAPVQPSPKETELAAKLGALEKRCSDLEATNSTLKDELRKVKYGKNIPISDQDEQEAAGKQSLEKIVPDLQAMNTTLNDELRKEKDDRKSIMNDLDRVKAEKQVLESKVSDLETMYATLNNELVRNRVF
ncbi:hypothetical protein MKX01_010503 [Papaver californicum]|nr:hypothetical protein MKX01_010503 [Papaver californicum]